MKPINYWDIVRVNYFLMIYKHMSRFKTFFGYSIDRINYADAPKQKDQFILDSAPSLNLIKIDEWSAPTKACPENGSIDTKNELLRMSADINMMDDDDQEDIVEKYDEFFDEFEKACTKNNLIFPEKYLTELMDESVEIITKIKWKYNRPRPYQLAPVLQIPLRVDMKETAKSPSFPSGHALQSKLVANVLSVMFPELEEKFQKIADKVAYSRYIGGLHFPSDLVYGVELADWLINYVVLPDQVDESKTIGKTDDLPNVSPNPIEPGEGEDDRLLKIRQFKGTVDDYKNYWDDRINKGAN